MATVAFPIVLLGPGSVAWADDGAAHSCAGSAVTRRGGGEAGGECEGGRSTAGPGSSVGGECDPNSLEIAFYDDPPSDDDDELLQSWSRVILNEPHPPEGMTWMAGYNCAGRYRGGPFLVADPAWAEISSVRDEARTRVQPPLPVPNVSPSEAVVRTPTWLWIDDGRWQPASASASAGAVTVRVEARPSKVSWDLEEGVRVCEGPGIPWSDQAQAHYESQPEEIRGRGNPACTFTFVHSSSTSPDGVYHASVTVTWELSWWLNGTARGVFGTVDATSEFELRVGEVEALITDQ